ncbi:tetratricopeptide repeat protein [Moorena sp. SIO3B2]|uniref:CHAT domain-containing tetratricopeptide repeat protein n=1 Tax=Moorena sp. SIO3B2 TaxID=2607827 RepID=UPI0013CBC8A6|nr:tetratricopeptide repeat protein [Moorena sp. SIO3B2]NEP35735.1 tetratricopeptide repeat protein [Moorena sp. SIO3B2]
MDKRFAVKPGQRLGRSHRYHLGLILLLCLSFCSETLKAHPQPTDLNSFPQLIAQTDTRTQAQELSDQGMELFQQGTAESLQQAITKWEAALPLWRELEDKSQEAFTLLRIGFVYSNLGFKQKALEYYNPALSIYRAIGDRSQQAVTLNNIGLVYDDLGEKPQALDYYHQALPLRRAVGDHAGEARTLTNIGLVYDDLGKKQQALEYYQQALPLWRAVGDHKQEAVTLTNIGLVYDDLGKKQQALEYYQQALPLWRAVGDHKQEAVTLNNIGKVYSDLREKQQALEYYQRALSLSRAVGDHKQEAVTLNNIGKVYSDLGETQQALEYYHQALPLSRAVDDPKGQAATLNNIGKVYSDLGEKQQALEYYHQALPLSQTVANPKGQAVILNNIGRVYDDLGEKQQALDYYQQALPLSKVVDDHAGEARTLNNIGLVYDALGEKQQALDYYLQALPLWQTVGDRAGKARTLTNIGAVYNDLGEKRQALDNYHQALPLSRVVSDRAGEARTLNNIGFAYDALGKKQQALDYYRQALSLSQAIRDRAGEALILYNIAFLQRSQGNLQAALTPIQDSIRIIEDLRTKASVSPELRQTYFSTLQVAYQLYISLLMELHQQNPSQGYDKKAFHISERSRARTLLELLTEANANIKEGVDPQLLADEKRLQGKLDATETQRLEIYNNPNSTDEQKTAIDKQHKTILKEYEDLKNDIRAKSPKYADLKDPEPLTLEQVQQQVLDPDTVLLQYSLGREKSYLWVVTKEEMSSYELPSQKDIEKRAKNLLRAIKQGNPKILAKAVPLLSQVILDPAKDKLTKKRIVVVADGVLQYIPFASLSVSENQQPLITNYDIINLPSSSSLGTIRHETQARKSAPKGLAVLADPVFSIDDERVKNGKTNVSQPEPSDLGSLALQRSVRNLEEGFDSLPGTRQEAEAILNFIPEDNEKTSAFDFDANLTAATNPELSQYRIVHLATHGILNTESPELSGIVLSLVDETGNSINGFLRLHEIFNLKLPAEIVVLSACQTGVAKDIKGEGLVGLTRGFMYAGSPRVLVSLWKVDDEATAEIMTRFYRLMLKKKLSPAEALRKAQLEMQQETEWKSPYYWAAFVLQGEWN